jgi:hypothetical protein
VKVLVPSDVNLVVKELGGSADKWNEIGAAFKLSATFLEELKAKGKGGKENFVAVITRWLSGDSARPTWIAIRDVLRKEEVGMKVLADKLNVKYSLSDQNSGKMPLLLEEESNKFCCHNDYNNREFAVCFFFFPFPDCFVCLFSEC